MTLYFFYTTFLLLIKFYFKIITVKRTLIFTLKICTILLLNTFFYLLFTLKKSSKKIWSPLYNDFFYHLY